GEAVLQLGLGDRKGCCACPGGGRSLRGPTGGRAAGGAREGLWAAGRPRPRGRAAAEAGASSSAHGGSGWPAEDPRTRGRKKRLQQKSRGLPTGPWEMGL
ncbi:unnamed protein product, partial [Urochloa humidicola]